MELWDDFMSLPWLLCRSRSISIEFTDEQGGVQQWSDLGESLSELLQHELDHLDGILITDRYTLSVLFCFKITVCAGQKS